MDFRVTGSDLQAACDYIHNIFAEENPVDPLTGRKITDKATALGYYILIPDNTEEIKLNEDV